MRVDPRQPHDPAVPGHEFAIEFGRSQLLRSDFAGKGQPADRRAQAIVLRLTGAYPFSEDGVKQLYLGFSHHIACRDRVKKV